MKGNLKKKGSKRGWLDRNKEARGEGFKGKSWIQRKQRKLPEVVDRGLIRGSF
jgi:hypothetical protein